jgi:hypothetical protein
MKEHKKSFVFFVSFVDHSFNLCSFVDSIHGGYSPPIGIVTPMTFQPPSTKRTSPVVALAQSEHS